MSNSLNVVIQDDKPPTFIVGHIDDQAQHQEFFGAFNNSRQAIHETLLSWEAAQISVIAGRLASYAYDLTVSPEGKNLGQMLETHPELIFAINGLQLKKPVLTDTGHQKIGRFRKKRKPVEQLKPEIRDLTFADILSRSPEEWENQRVAMLAYMALGRHRHQGSQTVKERGGPYQATGILLPEGLLNTVLDELPQDPAQIRSIPRYATSAYTLTPDRAAKSTRPNYATLEQDSHSPYMAGLVVISGTRNLPGYAADLVPADLTYRSN